MGFLRCALVALFFLPAVVRGQGVPLSDFEALRYIASHPDLIQAFGADAAKGRSHYETWGVKEGRRITFDPLRYTASHPDLIAAFGTDPTQSVRHYIQWGFKEGRKVTFDPLRYIASHPDLVAAFGSDETQGVRHYIQWGFKEGRKVTFDPLRYIASHPDLIQAFGLDETQAVRHYLQWGYKEGRKVTFDPLRYMASHPDLIQAFGGDEVRATSHYIQWGFKEKRQTTFSDLDALSYIASFGDLIRAFGADVVAGIRHYVTWGYQEGRKAVFDALSYIASYGDLIAAFGADALAGARHYITWGFGEGRQVLFDPAAYLERFPDVQRVFGNDAAAAARHFIVWGFQEGRRPALRKYPITVSSSTGGSISPNGGLVEHGSSAEFRVTSQDGFAVAGVSGCGGSLIGDVYRTAVITSPCSISAAFVRQIANTSIEGVWTGIDSSRPAFVAVSSESDDSFLKVVPVSPDGSFKVTGLDPSRRYIVEPEQTGTKVVAFKRVSSADADAASAKDTLYSDETSASNSPAVSPGVYISFDGTRVPGLTEGEFVYRWEGNNTASGAEYSSYVPKPLMIERIGDAAVVADPQASVRLAEEYGIVLVNPSTAGSTDQLRWTTEYADRFLQMIKATPLRPASQGTRSATALTYVELVSNEIENDIRRVSGDSYLGGRVQVSASAFTYASPLLARVEGRRGIFFSNRLFRVALRMVTEDGRRRDVVAEMMKSRYGITVATRDDDALLISPVTCPQFSSDCLDAEWKVFNPDEFFDLLSILEEFPEGLRDFSQPGKAIGLRHLLRRRDGIPHPLYPQAGAVAWPENGYAEFMEAGLRGSRSSRHALIVHEKAHFVWAGLLSPKQRYDWLRLSGWYRVPKLVAGEDVRAVGRCEQWQSNPDAWTPANVTDADIGFTDAIRHDPQNLDSAAIKKDWASCSTTQFVTPYAATINPNEDFAESFASFLLSPDLLRSRALPKYEFIRDRLMQGSFYISRIRQDLTFEVFNLYPDYTYPGKIKSVDVRVVGGPSEDKKVTVRIALHVSEGCDSAKNSGCFDGASSASMRIFSRLDPPTIRDMYLAPVTPRGDVLEGTITVSRLAANGWWQVESITTQDKVGNVRISKQSSKDFGWKLYINNPGEDLTKPSYIPGSIALKLVAPGDPLASSGISGDEREMVTQYRFKEKDAGGCYVRTSYSDPIGDPARRIYKGTFDDWGVVEKLAPGQFDGATHLCTTRHRVTRFWTSGLYSTVFVYLVDEAGNTNSTNFSPGGVDPNLERAPSLRIVSTNSDAVAPILDITPCKTADEAERCLRIKAVPTNPSAPNGETQVDLFYWAYEDQPLSNASGLDGGTIVLRDPLGKTFFFYLNESVGVVNRRPLRRIDGNYYFSCPAVGASKPCDATTPVQYQMRVILPVGSAPGLWGLQEMSVYDKVSNSRGYDFTETFTFRPSVDGPIDGRSGGYTFAVEAQRRIGTIKSVPSTPMDAVRDIMSAITAKVRQWMFGVESWIVRDHATSPVRGQRADGPGGRFMPGVGRPSTTAPADERYAARGHSMSGSIRDSVSVSEDPSTGSRYQVVREVRAGGDRQQGWTINYGSNLETIWASKELPDTAEVLWRTPFSSSYLPTTAWARVCNDRVWSMQDGYQMLFHVGDRLLSDLHSGQLWVDRQTEVTVIKDVRCTFGGSVWVEGYAFGANDIEPLLRIGSVTARRFGFAIDRLGRLTRREVSPSDFEVAKHCTDAADEQLMFCARATAALAR